MTKILLIEGENVKLIEKTGFAEEAKLQDYLEKYPSLIPLADIVEGASDLLCIGREVPAGLGAVDLLFIDKDGLLTVVETKLAKNPEARRTVIGQIIEYASYISQWTADDVYRMANTYLKSDIDEAIGNMSEGEFSADDFRSNIEQNLKNGRMRLIIGVDELIEPLRAMVTFLNSYSNFDIFLLQVSSFEESEVKKVLFPSLFGYTTRTAQTVRQTVRWDEESFFTKAREKCEPTVVDTITRLYEFTKSNADAVNWGTGASYGSFTFRKSRYGVIISIFTVQSDGRMYISFGGMKSKVKEETLHSFRTKLNKIPSLKIPEDVVTLNKYPYMKVEILVKPDSVEIFEDAVLFLCQEIESDDEGKKS